MKFSQKIFIMSFILVITSMDILGYLIIKNNHEVNIEKEMTMAIEEHNAIRSSLISSIQKQESILNTSASAGNIESATETGVEVALKDNLIEIIQSSVSSRTSSYIELYKENSLIYSNFLNRPEGIIEKIKPEQIQIAKTYITQLNGKEILLVSSMMEIFDKEYNLISARDLSFLYRIREQQIEFFIKVSISMTFIITILLAIFVVFLTRRIQILTKAISNVSDGDYSSKVKSSGQDEIAILSRGFNNMVDSVNQNVTKLQELSENRQTFINDLTHEIRTPLTSIIGFSNLLRKVRITNPEMIENYSNKIYEEGKYIKNISDKLMQMILLENKKVPLVKNNLSELVHLVVETMQESLKDKIQIQDQIQEDIYQEIDQDLIKSLLINLIRNSSKAYKDKGIILVTLSKEKIEVIDQGKGIPKEELGKIKEPFYTLNKARTREDNNMGLGLPLCYKIVQIHGYEMYIDSKEGEGTKVTIILKKEEKI